MLPNIKTDLKKLLNIGAGYLYLANGLIQVSGAAFSLIIAFLLTPTEIGEIKYIQSITGIAVLISSLGLNTGILKVYSKNQQLSLNNLFSSIKLTTISASIILSILSISFIFFSSNNFLKKYILPFGLIIIFNSISELLISYTQAKKRFRNLSKILIFQKLIAIIIVLTITIHYGIHGYIYATTTMAAISLLVIGISNKNEYFKIKDIGVISLNLDKEMKRISKHGFLAGIIGWLTVSGDILLINNLSLTPETIGFYSFAVSIVFMLRISNLTVQQLLSPYFSSKGDSNSILRFYHNCFWYFIIIILILAAASLLLYKPVLNFLFGEKYFNSYEFIPPLILVWFLKSLSTIPSLFLFGQGRIDLNLRSTIYGLMVFVCSTFLSYKYLDIYAIILGLAFGNVISFYFSHFVYSKQYLNSFNGKV